MKNFHIMRFFYLLFSLLTSFILTGQSFYINPNNIEEVPCIFDSSQLVKTFLGWEIYQTIDNTWTGEIDNTNCPNLIDLNNDGEYNLDLNSIDINKAIFFRSTRLFNPIMPNTVLDLSISSRSTNRLTTGTNCPNNICSGLIVESQHYDTNVEDTLNIESKFPFLESNCRINNNIEFCRQNTCYPSQKLEKNIIKNIVYKFTFDQIIDEIDLWSSLLLIRGNLEELIDQPLYIVPEDNFDGNQYEVSPRDIFSNADSYLVVHHKDGFPSPDNIAQIELIPEQSKQEPTPINLNFENESFSFQEFAQFIGGKVEGQNEMRHPVNLNLAEQQICISVIDFIIPGGSKITYSGGSFEFNDVRACLQFRHNSTFVIEKETTTQIGDQGVGNINLMTGSKMILKEKAQVYFGGNFILTPDDKADTRDSIILVLNQGSKFVFDENTVIYNGPYNDQEYLYIKDLGGNIDISKLKPQYKNKIKFLENDYHAKLSDVMIYPNPGVGLVHFSNLENTALSEIRLLNINGQELVRQKIPSDLKEVQLDLSTLNKGLYLIELKTFQNTEYRKYLIQ